MDISLIYLLVALNATIAEANSTADRLGLRHARISDLAQVQDFPLLPPRDEVNRRYRGLDAAVRTRNFNFAVDLNGIGVAQLHGRVGVEDWRDNDHQFGVPRGSVTEQMAHQQACGWLRKMGVDVVELEKAYPPRIQQLKLPLTSAETVSGGFRVKWSETATAGKLKLPAVQVFLNASEKWLVSLNVYDLRFYRHPVPDIPHAIAINLLPDEPVCKFFGLRPGDPPQKIFTEYGFGYTNAFKLLQTPKEYEAQARQLLLTETKQILSILDCDQLDEPNETNLTDFYVNPPAFGSGGRLEFQNGEIQFDSNGRLRLFRFLPRGQTNYPVWLSTAASQLTTNEAYQIATQKVAALSIDTERLDRDYERTFARGRDYMWDENKRKVWFSTPEYWLGWRDRTNKFKPYIVLVAVFGDVKQVGEIKLLDTSYWKRPPVVVTNREEFISTRQFSRPDSMSPVNRSP